MKVPGIIDGDLYERASQMGIKLNRGSLSKQDGRVRIFCHQFPGTTDSGYALRSRIVWWLYTGDVVSGGEYDIHHVNHDRADDRIENLEKLSHKEHAHEHNGHRWENVLWAMCKCKNCGKEFKIQAARFKDTSSGKRGSFCSQKCYHKYPRSLKTHCPNGHEYVDGSYYPITDKRGYKSKSCKICRIEKRRVS